eukprot:CAMPEP_0114550554 /NCGR_PEP_ID=MMETSP0114-20121206/6134_1 /TAXON_ID=31324 /ORGANISM="Goniomonas sp, Strain m" /LENGTH=228 /DNA_ID=CAMNT_0001735333 /DNA_START=205 /DNA_END=891 /DNA_ORIENTATION=-
MARRGSPATGREVPGATTVVAETRTHGAAAAAAAAGGTAHYPQMPNLATAIAGLGARRTICLDVACGTAGIACATAATKPGTTTTTCRSAHDLQMAHLTASVADLACIRAISLDMSGGTACIAPTSAATPISSVVATTIPATTAGTAHRLNVSNLATDVTGFVRVRAVRLDVSSRPASITGACTTIATRGNAATVPTATAAHGLQVTNLTTNIASFACIRAVGLDVAS